MPTFGGGWRPLAQAALTSGTVMAAGDVLCQAIRCRSAGREVAIDRAQAQRFALIGLTLHGPYFFRAFRWLDKILGPSVTMTQAAMKTALGQCTVFPVYVIAFNLYMGVLEGLSPRECWSKVERAAPPTLVAGTAFWPFVNVINFYYVSPAGRMLYVNVAGLFWNAWLSYENSTKGKVEHQQQQHTERKK